MAINPNDAAMTRCMWSRIDPNASTITASDGTVCPYELTKARKWNGWMKRYDMVLTGGITVYTPGHNAYRIVDCWSDAIMFAERYRANA